MNKPKITFCSKCTNPSSSAVPLEFNENGVCSGCLTNNEKANINWKRRKEMFVKLLEEYRSADGAYDCVIPVSGGKDSYYQVHLVKELGFNPLLVTYNANNYTKTGMDNLINMREVFNVDHIFFTPGIDVIKRMNRVCQRLMGDMNWHGHAGMYTYPIRAAVAHKTPLMIWGEHGFMDLGGMHSYKDFVEFTYRFRHEHNLRGYEWYDIVEASKNQGDEIYDYEMTPWKYPSDEEIVNIGVRGVFVSNYFPWDANDHGPEMIRLYGFKESEEEFERTYRKMSNLDDMHENGIHDYMKWIKFGYGRATDHTSKDIRKGLLTREEGIEITLKRDPIKSKDIWRWLDYVGWSEEEFDQVADRFRDPRVWYIKDNMWYKLDIDGQERNYGLVNLSEEEMLRYYRGN
jgi:N-acetyl sugar amidotransferase